MHGLTLEIGLTILYQKLTCCWVCRNLDPCLVHCFAFSDKKRKDTLALSDMCGQFSSRRINCDKIVYTKHGCN